jgi:hypothetical protein
VLSSKHLKVLSSKHLKVYALFNEAIEILTINGLNFKELGQDDPLNQATVKFELGAMV